MNGVDYVFTQVLNCVARTWCHLLAWWWQHCYCTEWTKIWWMIERLSTSDMCIVWTQFFSAPLVECWDFCLGHISKAFTVVSKHQMIVRFGLYYLFGTKQEKNSTWISSFTGLHLYFREAVVVAPEAEANKGVTQWCLLVREVRREEWTRACSTSWWANNRDSPPQRPHGAAHHQVTWGLGFHQTLTCSKHHPGAGTDVNHHVQRWNFRGTNLVKCFRLVGPTYNFIPWITIL